MGWAKYMLLGNLGNRLDLNDADRRMKRMRASVRKRSAQQSGRDDAQELRLQALEEENDEIKLLFIDLVDTLIKKNILSNNEVAKIIRRASEVMPKVEREDDDQPLDDLASALSGLS